jgi:hypothetical protein
MAVQDQLKVNGVQYRLQPRKCGKLGCKCNIPGQEHGPYWYSYDGTSAAKYVGAKLPEHIVKHQELLKASGPKLKKLKTDIAKRRDEARQVVARAELELRTLANLEAGEYTASEVLKALGLGQFTLAPARSAGDGQGG